ncbi:histidine kinase [Microbacterium sp. NPDC089189]|uniref:sensor histidine kinase n=1 Tax=Microbacterium sp. NPDC089189 TaxID=3154972 RepID=UPI003443B1BD
MTSAPPAPPRARPLAPVPLAGAIAQMALLGVVGPAILTAMIGFLGTGIGLIPALGIGLIFLVGFVYALFGIAWLETARIDGLYRLGLPALRLRPRPRPGFGGYLLSLWHQLIDPSMWRAVANLAIASALGLVVIPLVSIMSGAIALAFAPLFASTDAVRIWAGFAVALAWAPLVGILAALLCVAALIGLGVLHGVLSRALLLPSRTATLTAQARTSDLQRVGAIRASEVERTRIERDLHDGVQPRLVSVGMTLGLAQQKIDNDPAAAKALIEEAHTSTKSAITELRQLARGIHASVLDDRGLDAALSALAARSHVPVVLDVRLDGRCSRDAETALYFSIAESLTNAAKHSRAAECRVVVRVRDGGTLWARIEDNGIGGARVLPGGGLDGISNRVLAAGGTVRLDSPVGGPTALEVSVPCAS